MKNLYTITGDTTIIHCWCKGEPVDVMISTKDLDKVKEFPYKWMIQTSKSGTQYAYGQVKNKNVWMHRLIIDTPDHLVTDHINHNGLDNRRHNLRAVTQEVNLRNKKLSDNNTTGHKGVYWDKFRDTYVANISIKGNNITLGRFKDIGSAIEARMKGEIEYWGSQR